MPPLSRRHPRYRKNEVFLMLTLSGALQSFAKSFSYSILLIANPIWLLLYLAIDHVLYQIYCIIRGEHHYFIPGMNRPLSAALRACKKLVVDSTSCWQARSPLHMHGCCFTFSQIVTHASVFVSIHLYTSSGHTTCPLKGFGSAQAYCS